MTSREQYEFKDGYCPLCDVTIEYYGDASMRDCPHCGHSIVLHKKPNLTLRDILPEHPLKNIEVRTYGTDGEDMLFGFCHWTGTELVSGDGDSYYIDDPVIKYEFDEQTRSLTYWFKGVWL